ncbi:ABC transporter permease [Amycolatopsis thermophila]|uniref:ABC-type antimicrobial peptide transport system permease subunit n=1 Tax=Amycolatopsis thermophila TaxID=206084 RepID=A0ABU0EUX8_9PSEU|nr:FtsX-like permease family protein [Amycolatopsis thermophila]MDQ0379115.1 ABC-type antimicrobial peptide transport system permease subunit [Amycolatopsis thermophila]
MGVLSAAGDFADSDDTAFAPLTAVQASLTGFGAINQIAVRAASAGAVPLAQSEITAILDARHHVTDPSNRDFQVTNPTQLLVASSSAAGTFTVLLAAVAALSLLVGGIGVTNIMLVTITERTREIGIRKALGTPRWAILGQFLAEATMLSVLGGVLGVAAGVIGSRFTIAGIEPVLVPSSIVLSFAVTLALVALVLLAAGFAGGVWVGGSASSGGSGPAAGPQQTQTGGRTGGYGGFPRGQGGLRPGSFSRG